MPSNADAPNVLKVTAHDLGQHLGCYGVETVRTPAIDGLAADGVRFENAYAAAPSCSPSRAAMMTGRFPHQNGVMGLTHGDFAWNMNAEETHLAELLSDHGWESILSGNQHEMHDPTRVYDERLTEDTDCDVAVEGALEYLGQRADDEPFFCEVGTFQPHREPGTDSGYGEMPEDFRDSATIPEYLHDEPSAREDVAAYEGAIERFDRAVGTLLEGLEEQGLRESTIVIVTTEHGPPYPRAKCSGYSAGNSVCLVVDGPGIADGVVREELINNVDYLPTLCDRLDVPEPEGVEGRSFLPLLTGEGEYDPREQAIGEQTYHCYYNPIRWLQTEDYRLIVNFTSAPVIGGSFPVHQQYRFKTKPRRPEDPANTYHSAVELYHTASDPDELTDLADDPEHADVRRDLLDRLYEWMHSTDDPLLEHGERGVPEPPIHRRAMVALRGD
jgi:arylsulfatase A-like enzyme